jgi:uncharacterized protein YjiS (DUF1127 family)
MTPRHLEDVGRGFAAPAMTVARHHGAAATLPVVGARPLAGFGSTAARALARTVAACVTWHERARQRSALMQLSDYMLYDIGISRAAAIKEAEKPFWRS